MALFLRSSAAGDGQRQALRALGLPVQEGAGSGHQLLLDPRARPDRAWAEALGELLAAHPQALLLGRAWCLEATPQRLDPPDQPSWLLLPPQPELTAELPPHLAADPAQALAQLLPTVAQQRLPVLEASDVAPLQRTGAPAPGAGWSIHPATARRLGRALPEAPALELLLLAPAAHLPALEAAVQPAASLPWQVISQPMATPAALPEALGQALQRSRAELLWLLLPRQVSALPPPALLAAALRQLRRADLDGLALADHGLVLRRCWWLDALPPGPPEQLANQARQRGAWLGSLPLQPQPADGTMDDPDPLWPALLAQLDRAEALLLAQQQRIHSLEQQQRQLRAQLNRGAASPAPPPDDPTAG